MRNKGHAFEDLQWRIFFPRAVAFIHAALVVLSHDRISQMSDINVHEHVLPGSEDSVMSSPRHRPNKVTSCFKSSLLPGRVCCTWMNMPCRRIRNGPKRPTWSKRMELLVATLRTATQSIPRDPGQFRFWADRKIPDVVLPVGAVRSKSKIDDIVVDWIWPRHFVSEFAIGKRQKKTREKLSKERVQMWSQTHPVVLYLHGGAYIVCSSATHREMVYSLVIKGDYLAVVPNYRRVPEVSVIDAVDDCYKTYLYLTNELEIDPSRICIMGDSAGGALSLLTLLRIRDSGKQLPACSVLLSPWVDISDEALVANAHKRTMPDYDYLPYDAIRMVSQEVSFEIGPKDPRINPMYADIHDLPPILIHAGEVEVLRPQIERFVERCPSATYEIVTDMVHVPHMFSQVSTIAEDALVRVGQYVNEHISPP